MRLLHICCIYDSLYAHIIEAASDVSNYLMQFSRCFLVEVQTVVILRSVDGAQQTHHLVDVLVEYDTRHTIHVYKKCNILHHLQEWAVRALFVLPKC